MMRPSQSIVIDDDPVHLIGLAETLNGHDMPCSQIPFNGDVESVGPYPEVRFIFADLHLGASPISSGHQTDFSTIGSLLEDSIKPVGRYAIFLWTMYPDQAPKLKEFLHRLRGVPEPVEVYPLAKPRYLTEAGQLRNETQLLNDIQAAADKLQALLEKPEKAEIKRNLDRLFASPAEIASEVQLQGLPGLEVHLGDWLEQELAGVGTTPKALLESGDPNDLCLLERVVHEIATSRASSHPRVVRDIVCRRIRRMYEQGVSLVAINGPDPSDRETASPFDHWMDSANPLFGVATPRQFFEGEEVDVLSLQHISARLDAIDDGAFS